MVRRRSLRGGLEQPVERAAHLNFASFSRPRLHDLPVIEDLPTAFARVGAEVSKPHRHDYFEVFVMGSGEASLWFNQRAHRSRAPCLCLLPPGVVHAWHPDPRVEGRVLRVPSSILATAELTPLATLRRGPSLVSLPAEALQRLDCLVDWLSDEIDAATPLHNDILRTQVLLLFLEIARAAEPAELAGATVGERALLDRFLTLVEANYLARWSMPDYAARLRVGRVRLARVTQRLLGKSPATLVQDRLIAEARRLVVQTDSPLGQVAQDLGFPSQAYFSRVFRLATGMAPTDYRSRAAKDARRSAEHRDGAAETKAASNP